MSTENVQLIDNRFIYTTESKLKYIVTVDFRKAEKTNKPLLKIGLCRDAKNKKRLFDNDFMVKQFLEQKRKYKILKTSGKQINCLLELSDLKTDKFDNDFEEIKTVFKEYYIKKTNEEFEDFDIKLIYDGYINYAINMYKTSWTIVIDPSLNGKISYNKLKKLVLKNNTNRNLDIKVRFQHGKYIPKVKKEGEEKITRESIKEAVRLRTKNVKEELEEEIKLSYKSFKDLEEIKSKKVKDDSEEEVKSKSKKAKVAKKGLAISSESDEDVKPKVAKKRAPKKKTNTKVNEVLE